MLSAAIPGHHFWHLPANASAHGPALDAHLLLNLWIALTLLAFAHGILLIGLATRPRLRRPGLKPTLLVNPKQGPEGPLSLRQSSPEGTVSLRNAFLVEYLPLAALTMLFAFLAIRAQQLWAAQRYTGADPAAMQVEVTGMQFAWYFRYPGVDAAFGGTKPTLVAPGEGNPLGIDPSDMYGTDDIVTSQLVLPAGREVDLALRAQDVIHGFAVPEMRLKQNAVPGQTAHIHFTPTVPGDYAILCTQLCGLGHYRMQATMRVLTPADFDAWLRAKEQAAASQGGVQP